MVIISDQQNNFLSGQVDPKIWSKFKHLSSTLYLLSHNFLQKFHCNYVHLTPIIQFNVLKLELLNFLFYENFKSIFFKGGSKYLHEAVSERLKDHQSQVAFLVS